MNAVAISSPLQQRILQEIHDLQAEIGREAARAYCACQLGSPRFVESRLEKTVQGLSSDLGTDCDLSFDGLMNFPLENCLTVDPSCSNGKMVNPIGATTTAASRTINRNPDCPSNGRLQKAVPVIQAYCLLRKVLHVFLDRYWDTLHSDGLFNQIRSQCIDPEDPQRTRRLRNFRV